MIDLSQYRFKTKKEFIAEFGEDWRGKLRHYFSPSMNILFGRTLNTIKFDDNLDNIEKWLINNPLDEGMVLKHPLEGYFISHDMITKKVT